MRFRLLQSLLVVTTLSAAGTASAHFALEAPTSNNSSGNGGKGAPPCGPDVTPGVITPVMGGSMIMLSIDETTPHPGHYRVALALKSRDELDPSKPGGLKEPEVKDSQGNVITSGTSASAAIQDPPVFPVIADGVFPHTSGGGEMMTMIQLPNVNCDKCTLQVIEFMAQHGPDYFYRHCADLKITADPAKPIFDPNGMGGGGAGGTGGGGTGGAGGASGGAGGASGGAAGSATGGSSSGGAPATGGVAGSNSTAGSAPTTAGTSTGAAGTGTGTGSTPAATEDDGSCTIARAGGARTSFTLLAGALLLGLGWFARRRNRPE
jgi:hypothetical protein